MSLDVKTLCLGVLCMHKASGYEIKKHFEEAFSYMYGAGYGSIYPALAKLTKEQLITCENVNQTGKPDKKIYEITSKGKEFFMNELIKTEPSHQIKSAFLVQMFFASMLPLPRLKGLLKTRVQEWDQMLGCMQEKLQNQTKLSATDQFCLGFGLKVVATAKNYVTNNQHLLISQTTEKANNE